MKHLVRRRARQAMRVALEPVRLLGPGARRWTEARVNARGKRYIPPGLGVRGFFAALEAAGVAHVVLRWFEELPHVARGHDVDILVSDEGMAVVDGLLSYWPRGQQIDVFSVSGANGGGFRPDLLGDSVPGFPPAIAAEILETRRAGHGPWGIPAPRQHALGLAYHAVYLKGYQSGLPPDGKRPPRQKGSRDYDSVLRQLAPGAGLDLPDEITLESLDGYLAAQGWRPERAHLEALKPFNRWLSERP
ncbi:hypothetical protein OG2516_14980 [Oceanicola granulosus HTCC2516]|uniref:Uncharacterized protein n=1 Tax=Oceanicola granulosus (strain ATCC BAA-861 / DSM 15982 / KCTC 12143 / HTCC2516) TaxID=314256 RepID=Q2CER9_OCEGH|nr:hypothetical protein [Oceanicola granulosus]EAR51189.1 hypothetical protein OG2516_14980 [Oceanicola granulosus HTCC2516]